jgi:hypothetical protein
MSMRITALLVATIGVSIAAATGAQAQERYSYTVQHNHSHTRTVKINWKPEENNYRRFTVGVSPLRALSNGIKFDFEMELPRAGHWLGTSLVVYHAPTLDETFDFWGGSNDHHNNRYGFVSGFDLYNNMSGVGTSLMYKNVFHRRGWYFQTGLVFDYFEVGVGTDAYVPYKEDGLTFYSEGETVEYKSYYRPDVRFNFGKHMALSRRCFLDLYAGVGISYSIYADDARHSWGKRQYEHVLSDGLSSGYRESDYHYRPMFDDLGGFAYRGVHFTGGFRFGVLLWKRR